MSSADKFNVTRGLKMNKNIMEMIADSVEAMENVRKWKRLYCVVLSQTGSKEEALKAVRYVVSIAGEIDEPAESSASNCRSN